LALDSFSLGLTLRHMLTGVPPGMSVLSYAKEQGLLLPLLAGAAVVVQRIWRTICRACIRRRRRSVKRSAPAEEGAAPPAGAAAPPDDAPGVPAADVKGKHMPNRQCGAYVREYRYLEQASKPARSLVASLTRRDPRQRISAAEARRHEWMVGALLPPASGMPVRALSVPEGLCSLGRTRAADVARPQDTIVARLLDADGPAGAEGYQQVSTPPAGPDHPGLLPQHDASCQSGVAAKSGARSGSADRRPVSTRSPPFRRRAPLPPNSALPL
jgi:serine/threonine protein kinase